VSAGVVTRAHPRHPTDVRNLWRLLDSFASIKSQLIPLSRFREAFHRPGHETLLHADETNILPSEGDLNNPPGNDTPGGSIPSPAINHRITAPWLAQNGA